MSNRTDQQYRAIARRAFKLKQDGMTTRQIAAAINRRPEQVKGLVLLGERLLSEIEPCVPREAA